MEKDLDLMDAVSIAEAQLRGLGLLIDSADGDMPEVQAVALSITMIAVADKLAEALAKVQGREPVTA